MGKLKGIYLLRVKEGCEGGYDSYYGHVIIAYDKIEARNLCCHADEGAIWTDKTKTDCKRIGYSYLKAGCVLSNFNAG